MNESIFPLLFLNVDLNRMYAHDSSTNYLVLVRRRSVKRADTNISCIIFSQQIVNRTQKRYRKIQYNLTFHKSYSPFYVVCVQQQLSSLNIHILTNVQRDIGLILIYCITSFIESDLCVCVYFFKHIFHILWHWTENIIRHRCCSFIRDNGVFIILWTTHRFACGRRMLV